jgi:hypothetical protein
MTLPRIQRHQISIGILVLAMLLLAGGMLSSHKVYESESTDFGINLYHRVSDRGLTIDATFSGVVRRDDGLLYTTYDRSAPPVKRTCPT